MSSYEIEVRHGLGGATFMINVKLEDKVSDAKRSIMDHTGMKPSLQHLLLDDVFLVEDEKLLVQYGLKAESIISLTTKVLSGVYRYRYHEECNAAGATCADKLFIAEQNGSFIASYREEYESDESQSNTDIVGAGSWDSEVLIWDWRVQIHRHSIHYSEWQSSISYQLGLKEDAIAGSADTIKLPKSHNLVLLKTSESLDDAIAEIQQSLKAKLPFWPESGFSGLPSLVAQKFEEQEQQANEAKKANTAADAEKAAAKAKKEQEILEKVSRLGLEFPELAALLQQAHEAGLADAFAINTMWMNVDSGRFTAEHYLEMWKQRLSA